MEEVLHVPQGCTQNVPWRMKDIRSQFSSNMFLLHSIINFYITLLWTQGQWPIDSNHSNQRHILEERLKCPHFLFFILMQDTWEKLRIWEKTEHQYWLAWVLRNCYESLEWIDFSGLYDLLPILCVPVRMMCGVWCWWATEAVLHSISTPRTDPGMKNNCV